MRNKANWVLAAAFLLFLFSLAVKLHFREHAAAGMLFAVSEAALVGGIADWFAVTALFRKPLGFPWHTALIPRNRAKLGQAVVRMVQFELLSADSIMNSIRKVKLVELLIGKMERRGGAAFLSIRLAEYLRDMTDGMDSRELAVHADRELKRIVAEHSASPFLQSLASWLLKTQKDDALIEKLLGEAIRLLEKPSVKIAIRGYLADYAGSHEEKETQNAWQELLGFGRNFLRAAAEKLNIYNLDDAAEALQQELLQALQDVRDENHPLRRLLKQKLTAVCEQMETNDEWAATIEEWKKGVIFRLDLKDALAELIEHMLSSLREGEVKDGGAEDSGLGACPADSLACWLSERVEKYWHSFKNSQAMQEWLESYLQRAAGRIVESEHGLIGIIAEDVISRMTDAQLNSLVQKNTGQDLEWIRINGSLIGGFVGLGLYLFLHYIYLPLFQLIKQ